MTLSQKMNQKKQKTKRKVKSRMEFTKDQQQVIDSRNQNIVVSAAAGSGKTAVLTERIARKICSEAGKDTPIEELSHIERMLIVTFTKAAAHEMRERIGKRLREELKSQPDNVHIRKQIAILHTAQITTIDSFCLYIVRNHFEEIGLDPSFKIAMEEDTASLAQMAFDESIENGFNTGTKSFLDLIESYAPKGNYGELQNIVKGLAGRANSKAYPLSWLDTLKLPENTNPENLASMKFVEDYENILLNSALDSAKVAKKLTEGTILIKHYENAVLSIVFLEELLNKGFAERTSKIRNLELTKLMYGAKKFTDEEKEVKDQAKELLDYVKNTLDKLAKNFHEYEYEDEINYIKGSIYFANSLVDLTKEYLVRFEALKREANLIDFSDMEHLALKILAKEENGEAIPTDTALKYREYFEEIMVDEYQDSNDIQERLLSVISRENADKPNRFMVGDVKQSIYRFRLADPKIFIEKNEIYAENRLANSVRINLSKNFRSRKEVVDSVNAVFEKCMLKEIGGVEYKEDARLYLGADYPEISQDNQSEVLIFNNKPKDSGISDKEFEARSIALRIKELMEEGFKVSDLKTKETRPLRFSDIAILLRGTDGKDTIYLNELKRAGIPAFVISKKGYFGTVEVSLIVSLLSIIDNPRQDMPLFSVLKSFIGGFSDEDVAKIRAKQGRRRLYDSLVRYATDGLDETLKNKVEAFLADIEQFRKESVYTSAADMLDEIFDKYDYIAMVKSLPGGEQRAANMKLLQDSVYQFEAEKKFGVHDFVKYLEGLMTKDFDMGEANTLGENDDVVRILTIHKSKGLEYPVCFVSSLGSRFGTREGTVAVNEEHGIGSQYFDLANRTRINTLSRKAINRYNELDELGEEIRILYVALTRAKEKLILTGKYEDKAVITEYGPANLYGAKCFMDIVYPIVKKSEFFKIRNIDVSEILFDEVSSSINRELDKKHLLEIMPEGKVKEFEYPHESLDKLFTKTTVSELKKAAYLEREDGDNTLYHEEEVKVPRFIKGDFADIGGAMRGTAYHRVMELMDFEGIYDGGDLKDRLSSHRKKMVEDLFIEEDMDKLVGEEKVVDFLNTEVSHRMSRAAKAKKLYLEQPFVLSVNASQVREEFPESEQILVQGVIDVYFEEDGELVLLDYKTDRVDSAKELIDRYKTQLDYYSQALSRLEKKKVKEILIYSFALGEVIDVNNPAFIDKSSK